MTAADQINDNSGLLCFLLLARHHHIDLTPETLSHKYNINNNVLTPMQILRMAKDHGFKGKKLVLNWKKIFYIGNVFPFIGQLNDGKYIIVSGVRGNEHTGDVAIIDPSRRSLEFVFLKKNEFESIWSGTSLLTKKIYKISDAEKPFGLSWFIPEMLRYKTLFRDVGLATFTINILSLAFPIYIQLVFDKAVGHKAMSTLVTLSIFMVCALVFQKALSYLKDFITLYVTNKVDLRLDKIIYSHILKLPIDFFDFTPIGLITRYIFQKDRIREFITGRLLTTLFDTTIIFIIFPIIFFYSWQLACIVVLIVICILGIMAATMRVFRYKMRNLHLSEGRKNRYFVETLRGIGTIKSLALEPLRYRRSEEDSANTISQHHSIKKLSLLVRTITEILQQGMRIIIIWYGTYLVIDRQATIGGIIAFMMLSGMITSPLVKIIGLLHEYQEVVVSVTLLGIILNRPTEQPLSSRGLVSPISGSIGIEHVTFRYATNSPPALSDISLQFPAGSIIGIVGRSGSGKSTLTRLIQGLYPLQQGRITLDGLDMRDYDLAHMRRSIGVVLQESFLFEGTIRENIAVTKPTATFEEIVFAARMAGADEFIQQLPQGYDTMLFEGGSNLSGGQRQRVSIARALLTQPSILILDEATSALDAESEAIIQANLTAIAQGRTMLIVSHRLSMLTMCHSIIVLEKGLLIGNGPHDDLLKTCPIYADLWYKQNRHLMGVLRAQAAAS